MARRPVRRRGYGWFLLPGLFAVGCVIVIPLVLTAGLSFTRWTGVGTPEWIGLANYRRLFGDPLFWASFRHIALVVVAMAVLPTLAGLLLAAILHDVVAPAYGNRTASLFRSGFYLPQVLPIAVTGIVWRWILHPDYGALNRILALVGLDSLARNWLGDPRYALASVLAVLVWVQIGYPVVMFLAGLQRLDPQVHEAATLDGATWLQRFRRITVPLLRPELSVVLVTTTIAGLKVFAPVFVLTRGGPSNATLVPSYFAYRSLFERAEVGYGAAVSTVLTAMIVLLAAVFVRLQYRTGDR